jgi:hypothetical protein
LIIEKPVGTVIAGAKNWETGKVVNPTANSRRKAPTKKFLFMDFFIYDIVIEIYLLFKPL